MGKGTTAGRGAQQWRKWSEEQARGVLAELAASGESAAGFARRKCISTQRIGYWKKRLGEPPPTEFVAVALPSACSIEIAAGGIVVRVREDLDAEHVARLVEAIARRMSGAC